jgi:hypothetical protein
MAPNIRLTKFAANCKNHDKWQEQEAGETIMTCAPTNPAVKKIAKDASSRYLRKRAQHDGTRRQGLPQRRQRGIALRLKGHVFAHE